MSVPWPVQQVSSAVWNMSHPAYNMPPLMNNLSEQRMPDSVQSMSYPVQNASCPNKSIIYSARCMPHPWQNVHQTEGNVYHSIQSMPQPGRYLPHSMWSMPHEMPSEVEPFSLIQDIPHTDWNEFYPFISMPHLLKNIYHSEWNLPHSVQLLSFPLQYMCHLPLIAPCSMGNMSPPKWNVSYTKNRVSYSLMSELPDPRWREPHSKWKAPDQRPRKSHSKQQAYWSKRNMAHPMQREYHPKNSVPYPMWPMSFTRQNMPTPVWSACYPVLNALPSLTNAPCAMSSVMRDRLCESDAHLAQQNMF